MFRGESREHPMNKTIFNGGLRMSELPLQEQPYEKCLAGGAGSLTDAELLSVILRTGSRGEPAVALSSRLLAKEHMGGLLGLMHTSVPELMRIRGIGRVKAVQLLCVAELSRRIAKSQAMANLHFTDPASVADYYMEDLRHLEQEVLMVLLLDTKGGRLGEEIISRGTVNATIISPREIFICALRYHAVSIVLLHNHPSGNPQPSPEDISLTERVRDAGHLIGIDLIDHIIIGDQRYVSMYREGLL